METLRISFFDRIVRTLDLSKSHVFKRKVVWVTRKNKKGKRFRRETLCDSILSFYKKQLFELRL